MNERETHALLTMAAGYDPTMLPADDRSLAIKVNAWTTGLRKIDYEDGLAAVHDHYRRDTTKSVSVGIIYEACQGSRVPTGEHGFTDCNPLIIAPTSDAWGGRYEVWCRRCGFPASSYADTIGEAQILRDHHQYTPPTFTADADREADQRAAQIVRWADDIATTTVIPDDDEHDKDWSESETHEVLLEHAPPADIDLHPTKSEDWGLALTVECPWCKEPPHSECVLKLDGSLMSAPHPTRVDAARESLDETQTAG